MSSLMHNSGWNRREFVRAAALLGVVLGTPGCVSTAALGDAPGEADLAFMDAVSELVIPVTDTPGAAEAEVGAFVLLALAHGLEGSRDPFPPGLLREGTRAHLNADGSLDYLRWLQSRLPQPSFQALAALDTAAFAGDAHAAPWRLLKGLVLTGYYTSLIGGSQELQYAPLPGRYDPSLPVGPNARALSNEWTGVEFG